MVEIARSLPHGHVVAVLGTIRQLGLEELTGPAGSRQEDLVAAMIIAAVIDGSSKLATARGLRADRGQFARRGVGSAGLRRR
jgi:hypothetical protein